jgi:hypothetical protein
MMADRLTDAQKQALEEITKLPKPGGYDLEIRMMIELFDRGLVRFDASLTAKGRAVLEREALSAALVKAISNQGWARFWVSDGTADAILDTVIQWSDERVAVALADREDAEGEPAGTAKLTDRLAQMPVDGITEALTSAARRDNERRYG